MKSKLSLIGEVFHNGRYVYSFGGGRYFAFSVMDDNMQDGSTNCVTAGDVVIVKLDKRKTPPVASCEYHMSEDATVSDVGQVVQRLSAEQKKERKPRRCGYYLMGK